MDNDSKTYIKNLLDNQNGMDPVPTDVEPRYTADKKIKAVLFDIYGTLLISSSGDIDQAEISEANLARALDAARIKIIDNREKSLQAILNDFEYTIKICHESSKLNKIPYPEIDILSIWKIVLIHARRKGFVNFTEDADIMLMTCVFEFLSNRVHPMPGLKETIGALHRKNIPLGIVSNAQFYTPVLMNYFLNDKISLKERVKGFDRELTVFSYKFGKGKPDHTLYEELVPTFKWKFGLLPEEVLFVGNDMLKDIYASSQVGFRTALFAGDKRSLRMRGDDKRTAALKPDHVITELPQVLSILN
ncbi:MAG: HAD family hydrolase [Bacteroidales bacterium]|nr:HAD family hydrolase [Bacteroidales bacterium]